MTKELKKNMGTILYLKRKANNMTLRELAKVLNVSSQQITKYEKGVDNISSTRLWEIAEFFECSILDFFPSNKIALNKGITAYEKANNITHNGAN